MSFRPRLSDLVLPVEGASEAVVDSCCFEAFHSQPAELLGFFGGNLGLYFVMYVPHKFIVKVPLLGIVI